MAHYKHIRDVDWSTTSIDRAGILPYVKEGSQTWISLAISKFNTCITTFGGQSKATDFDLLETAVREYNEEVGRNFQPITAADLFDCYVIQSTYSILILYPVASRSHKFIPTKEIHDVLWITVDQLCAMSVNNERRLEYSSKHNSSPIAYLLSADIVSYVDTIIAALTEQIPKPQVVNNSIHRKKRIYPVKEIVLYHGIETFRAALRTKIYWTNSVVAIQGNNIAFGYVDKSVYIVPYSERQRALDTIVACNKRNINIYTMENNKSLPSARTVNFRTVYPPKGSRYTDLTSKLQLIYNEEEKRYLSHRSSGVQFNHKRAEFLNYLKLVNSGSNVTVPPEMLTILRSTKVL